MVDFNNEATIGTPAGDVVKILILQRHYDLLEAVEHYNKQVAMGQEANISTVKARLYTLFIQIQAMLKRRLPSKEYEDFKEQIQSDDDQKILEAIYRINEELDKINLTKIDTKKVYDSTNVEKENKVKGL